MLLYCICGSISLTGSAQNVYSRLHLVCVSAVPCEAFISCTVAVVLMDSGEVFAFGSNQFGQLGTGDNTMRFVRFTFHVTLSRKYGTTGVTNIHFT